MLIDALLPLGLLLLLAGGLFVFMPAQSKMRTWCVRMAVAGLATAAIGGMLSDRNSARQQVQQQREQQMPALRQAVVAALQQAKLPRPESIEVTDGDWLVTTFEFDDAALTQMAAAGGAWQKNLATKAVIAIRNAALPFGMVKSYRATLNGPSPGPGLILRYGSARFSEGSTVSWEPAPSR